MTTTTNRLWFIKSYICHVKARNWTLNYIFKKYSLGILFKIQCNDQTKRFLYLHMLLESLFCQFWPKILTLGGLCQTSISCRSAYFAFFNLWANNICTILCSAYIILTIQLYCKDHLRFAINFNMYDVWTWYLTVNRGLVFCFLFFKKRLFK